jgi:sec-independent protein translocase protein TatA
MGFISAPGPLEIVVILVVALLVLGPQRLPEVARSVGKGMREFKDSLAGKEDDPAELPMQTTDTTAATRERDTV